MRSFTLLGQLERRRNFVNQNPLTGGEVFVLKNVYQAHGGEASSLHIIL